MSKKPGRDRKKTKKVNVSIDSMVESDEHFGFIVGYTSNGAPYGLTHAEWNAINSITKEEKSENDNTGLPF